MNQLCALMIGSGLLACASMAATPDSARQHYVESRRENLLRRASFDLDCPAEQLEDVSLNEWHTTMGVKGCGRRFTYIWDHHDGWIANNAARTGESESPTTPR